MAVSSKPVAGVGVADREPEKSDADGKHDDVQHFSAPVAMRLERSYEVHMNARGRRSLRYRNFIRIRDAGAEPSCHDCGDELDIVAGKIAGTGVARAMSLKILMLLGPTAAMAPTPPSAPMLMTSKYH
jgi:hypothetical protein